MNVSYLFSPNFFFYFFLRCNIELSGKHYYYDYDFPFSATESFYSFDGSEKDFGTIENLGGVSSKFTKKWGGHAFGAKSQGGYTMLCFTL